MNPIIEVIRISGQIIIWFAAWNHLSVLIIAGIIIIIGGWFKGILYKR